MFSNLKLTRIAKTIPKEKYPSNTNSTLEKINQDDVSEI
jgi:hypothetical protein